MFNETGGSGEDLDALIRSMEDSNQEKLGEQRDLLSQVRESEAIFYEVFPKTPEEEAFEMQEITETNHISSGCSAALRVTLESGAKAILKDRRLEKRYEDKRIEPGSYFIHERAAYLVDRALDLGLVPLTVVREYDEGELASLQKDVPGKDYYYTAKPFDNAGQYDKIQELNNHHREDFIRLWLLDYILWSSDRNHRNVLLEEDNIHAIDNALSFYQGDEPVFFEEYYNEEMPLDIREKIVNLSKDTQKLSVLKDTLEGLLGYEGGLCMSRLDNLANIFTEEDSIPLEKYGTLRSGGDNYETSRNL